MVNKLGYMIRDKNSGRWHNYGGLTEWLPDSEKGGTLWFDKVECEKFADSYPKHIGIDAEVVTIHLSEMPKTEV